MFWSGNDFFVPLCRERSMRELHQRKMTKCAVKWCKSYGGGENKVSLHLFPRDPARRRKWVAAVRREDSWIPRKLSAICSLHFEDHCFNTNSKTQKKLKKDAVPTLYLPVYSHETNLLKRESSRDEPQVPDTLPNTEISDTRKREFMRKIQKQAKKIKRLQYLNRCLKKKIAFLEDALENVTNK